MDCSEFYLAKEQSDSDPGHLQIRVNESGSKFVQINAKIPFFTHFDKSNRFQSKVVTESWRDKTLLDFEFTSSAVGVSTLRNSRISNPLGVSDWT